MDGLVEIEKDLNGNENNLKKIATGYVVTESAKISTQQAAEKFAKPENYTGNRSLYDSGAAKRQAKMELFKEGAKVTAPYTGDTLVSTVKEAKTLYGENWQRHLAESDHVKPIEKIFNETKGNPWLTNDDIKTVANSDDNIVVVSRKYNNAKRSKTNKEFVTDDEYLESKGVQITEEGKLTAIRDEQLAEASVNQKLTVSSLKNAVKTGHDAGIQGAKAAGGMTAVMSCIQNVSAVIKGDKDTEEAVIDVLADTGKATVTGYMMGNGLTTISHTLSSTSSKFIQALSESNVPGKIITAVIVTGNTLKRYGAGEITTEECLIELGESGVNLATMPYSMAIGQTLIPVPVVGAAIGALVGSVLTSQCYHQLVGQLQTKELEHQERLKIIEECNMAAEQTKAYRKELEAYLEKYFKEYQDCFDEALSEIRFAYQVGDGEGIIAGANKITERLGGQVCYETEEEFMDFLDDDSAFVL